MPSLYSIALSLRSVGLSQARNILQYTRLKNKLDRSYRRSAASDSIQLGRLLSATGQKNSLNITFEQADLEITFLAPNLARVTWQPGSLPVPYAIDGVDWPAPTAELIKADQDYVFQSDRLKIRVNCDGETAFLDNKGRLLRLDLPPTYRKQISDQDDQILWTARSRHKKDELLAGLGEHSGPLDLSGEQYLLWNTDPGGKHGQGVDPLYMPLPVYVSIQPQGSYLVFYENSFKASFSSAANDGYAQSEMGFQGGALRYYFLYGAPDELFDCFSRLTGYPALPPRWSLGYQQSRWGYKTAAEIRQLIDDFARHDLPVSAIHLDIDYMHGYRVFTVDPARFPDLPALASDLHARKIKLATIIDPGVKTDPGYPVYRQGLSGDHFVSLPGGSALSGVVWPGKAAFPDFTRAETRRWWGELYRGLVDAGVDGIWHDMNEPASFVASGDSTLPSCARHDLDGSKGDHLEAHNLYGMQMNRAAYQGLQALRPETRPWIVSRSGWVGNSRYAWNWTADVETSWEGLRQTVASLISMSCSGIPFSGSDIGGFTGDPSPELYVRWFQMACFNAFMRTHSSTGTARREPWVFGEPYTTIIRETLRLRYQMMPYLYTTAWEAARLGKPMLRPCFWNDLQNQELWRVEDAFLLGEAMLVAPIVSPAAQSRLVTLPGGAWIDCWDHAVHRGPAVIEAPAPLERIPLLIRDNHLIPMEENDRLMLNLYITGRDLPPSPTLCGQVYSDSGDGYGPSRLDKFTLHGSTGRFTLTWSSEGDYPFPYKTIALQIISLNPDSITCDNQDLSPTAGQTFNQPFKTLDFRYH